MTGQQHIGVLFSLILFFPTIALIIGVFIQYYNQAEKGISEEEKVIFICFKIPALLFLVFEVWYWFITFFFFTKF